MALDKVSLGSLPEVKAVFRSALAEMVQSTQADRAVILFSDNPAEPQPKVRSAHNLPEEGFWTVAPVSTELLTQVRRTGEPLGLANVPDDPHWGGNFSMAVSSVRSLVCVPVWGGDDHPDGLLYVDWLGRCSLGVSRCQEILQNLARKIEGFISALQRGDQPIANPFQAAPKAAVRPQQPTQAARVKQYSSRSIRKFKAPKLTAQAVFFRSLSTLFQSGLPLQQGLFILAKQSEDLESKEIGQELGRRLERGQALSEAIEALDAFNPTVAELVKVGEQSGTLASILEQISKMEERRMEHWRRLQAGLLYPCLVAAFSFGFLLLIPGFLLSHLSGLLNELTPTLPWLTRVLIGCARSLAAPLSWLLMGLLTALAIHQRVRLGSLLRRGLRKLPGLKPVFQSMELCQFVQTLALQVQVGRPLQLALNSSSKVVGSDSPLHKAAAEMEERLLAGLELHANLEATGLFPPMVLGMVRVGEETGKLGYVLTRLTQFYEDDFLRRLDTLVTLLEPLVICGLGTGVGLMLLVTMLPMVRAIQAL